MTWILSSISSLLSLSHPFLFFLPFFSSSSPSPHNSLSIQPITRLLILSNQLWREKLCSGTSVKALHLLTLYRADDTGALSWATILCSTGLRWANPYCKRFPNPQRFLPNTHVYPLYCTFHLSETLTPQIDHSI